MPLISVEQALGKAATEMIRLEDDQYRNRILYV
jgi:hypothetical protein